MHLGATRIRSKTMRKATSSPWLLYTLSKRCFLLLAAPTVHAFVGSTSTLSADTSRWPLDLSPADPAEVAASTNLPERWGSHALLFSSLSDGIVPNAAARSFLRYSLTSTLLRERIAQNEDRLASSAEYSPCNGPNMEALDSLDAVDRLHERGTHFSADDFDHKDHVDAWANEAWRHLLSDTTGDVDVRILYIPTAMYALNPQSSNTPGKQRQRARSDGKKRRTQLLRLLGEVLHTGEGRQPHLLATTLDLDDGSLKQPVGSEDAASFPENATAALTAWRPHLIYVEGGNTFWLQHCLDKGGYAAPLKEALCAGSGGGAVYCGKSAGAIVAGGNVATATWKGWDDPSVVPGKGTAEAWAECPGLGLAGRRSFFPHMSDDWEEMVREKLATQNIGVGVCLREEDAYCVMGDKQLSFNTASPTPTE